jgi:DNA (cytosine-5)-methyltransferase 1
MRLLDLFAGAGGAARGYQLAGFHVTGIDNRPQPRYPFTFHEGDAMQVSVDFMRMFDVIHASPPCQEYSTTRTMHRITYPKLVTGIVERLKATGRPWVVENVVGAPFEAPALVCGSSFGLRVRRHRLFESSLALMSSGCRHDLQPSPLDVTGGGPSLKVRVDRKGGAHNKPRNIAEAREAMGIDWMTRAELNEAVPPAYTEFIGAQLMDFLSAQDSSKDRI